MADFSANQQAFYNAFVKESGIDPGVAKAWMAAEEPIGASSGYHGTQDWLNVGITDSGPMGEGNSVWQNPTEAGIMTAKWLKGEWDDPGFGKASAGIQAITKAKTPAAQIYALQHSGWASSGYPTLPTLYQQYAGAKAAPIGNLNLPQTTSSGAASKALKLPKGATTKTVTTPAHTSTNWMDVGIQTFLNHAPAPIMVGSSAAPIGTALPKIDTQDRMGQTLLHNIQANTHTTPAKTTTVRVPSPGTGVITPTSTGASVVPVPQAGGYSYTPDMKGFNAASAVIGPGVTKQIAARLAALGQKTGTTIYAISGYRTPQHSVAVGGYADDPHTQGRAIDIGVNGELRSSAAQLTNAQLASVGLWRPFDHDGSNPAEVNHIELIGQK